jgi:hypothetical protein
VEDENTGHLLACRSCTEQADRRPLNYPGNLYSWACCRCDHDVDTHEHELRCLAGGCTCHKYQSGHEDNMPDQGGGES